MFRLAKFPVRFSSGSRFNAEPRELGPRSSSKVDSSHANRPAKKARARLEVEALESRELMADNLTATFSDGVLEVEGTAVAGIRRASDYLPC